MDILDMLDADVKTVDVTASGRKLTSYGFEYDEPDSSLAIEDFYIDGKNVGYIMQSPSATKYTVGITGIGIIGSYREDYYKALEVLKEHL